MWGKDQALIFFSNVRIAEEQETQFNHLFNCSSLSKHTTYAACDISSLRERPSSYHILPTRSFSRWKTQSQNRGSIMNKTKQCCSLPLTFHLLRMFFSFQNHWYLFVCCNCSTYGASKQMQTCDADILTVCAT